MSGVGPSSEEQMGEVWRGNRPYLLDLAFGMLGDIGAAEDAVQEAFTRLSSAGLDAVDDPRGWLIVVTSRICVDQIRSARSRREQPQEPATLEPAAPFFAPGLSVDPADRITLDDEVRLALLVVLQHLRPAERVAFVLHDVFQMPFEAVATTMDRPVATCRQLARRARTKVQAAGTHRVPSGDAQAATHQQLVKRFIEACSNGQLGDLIPLLDPNVWGDVDLGPSDVRTGQTRHGARRVAGTLLRHFGSGPVLVSVPGMATAVILVFVERQINAVISFELANGVVTKVHVVADPAKMRFLGSQLAAAG